ncbi:16S rRNA (cytidine(1402)-2'-O)-methyltransferase [Stackebrandtia sp.]|jgi:16S rRNA (cytidine1402-2'-O)-methyltransferase|uniref:16S rRNA (cytidine(1402)-2'-O)-methyltransferase n=1 Tax=Stackebrandtia sp. TaxID=2023065 RepID=UPI0032C2446A
MLLGAPLGNVEDLSARLRRVLATADVVAAEDTRRLRRLAADADIPITGTVVSFFEGNERQRVPRLLEELRDGRVVAVITDAGMPSVSDPGFRLVRAAVDAGIAVSAVPGPSAATTALVLSGLPSDRFCFEGFLPRKAGERRTRLSELAEERRTMVFFESTHRIAACLEDLAAAFGAERPAALCREMTKTHEQVRRAGLGELASGAVDDPPRGEITVVVAGAPAPATTDDPAVLAAAVSSLVDEGVDRKEAMSRVARANGVPRRVVYDAVLAHRD